MLKNGCLVKFYTVETLQECFHTVLHQFLCHSLPFYTCQHILKCAVYNNLKVRKVRKIHAIFHFRIKTTTKSSHFLMLLIGALKRT